MTVGLTTAFIGPVSQAQVVTITASTVADEEEQKISIRDSSAGMNVIQVTGTEIGELVEGNTTNFTNFRVFFEEEVILTMTNNNPDDVRFFPGTLNPVVSRTITLGAMAQSSALQIYSRNNDNIVQGTQTYSLLFAWRPTGSTSTVSGHTASVSFTGIVRDDDGGFTLAPDPFLGATLPDIAEGEEETTFTVVLDGQPSSDVVLTLTSSTQVSLGTTALTFSNGDWDTSQIVTVTSRADNDSVDGDAAYMITVGVNTGSTDDAFDDLADQILSGTVTDNDIAGFTLTPLGGASTLAAIAEGENTTTFTVVLDAQPQSNVVLDLSTTSGDVSLSDTSVSFIPSAWDTPVSVTVTSRVDNNDLDGDAAYTVTVGVNAGSDDSFDSLTAQILSGTVTDNDIAGFTLAPADGSALAALAEGESTTTFTVVLDAQPQSNVVLDLSTTSSDVSLSDTSVSFIPSAWDTPVMVTVTSRADNDAIDGDAAYTVTVGVNTGSDDNFDGLTAQTLSGTVTDDDMAGFTLSTTTLGTISEDGGSTSFTVQLDAEPSSNVVLALTNSGKAVSLNVDTLTFTSGNWNARQTIMVSGVNNDVTDVDLAFMITVAVDASSDDDFDGISKELSGTVSDDEVPGFTLNPPVNLAALNESGQTIFTVVLNVPPVSGNVVIDLTSSDTAIATVTPAKLTFTAATSATEQTGTVTAVDDNTIGDKNYMIMVSVDDANSSTEYQSSVDPSTLSGIVNDDETAGFTLSGTDLGTILESGSSTSFNVLLDAEPDSDVVLTLTNSGKAVSLSATTLTFNSGNWDDIQTVMVEGIDDTIDDDEIYSITVSVVDASSDDNFDNVANQELSGRVTDDDAAGLTLDPDPSAGLEDIKEGDTGTTTTTFTVVLDTQPASGNVVIDLTSSDTAIATVTPAKLTFETGNWNTAQTGTVTSGDDDMVGTGQDYMITVAVDDANSSDEYAVIRSTLSGTVNEDDAGLIFASLTLTDITVSSDVGTTGTVKLSIDPTGTVVLALTSSNSTVAMVSPAMLTFTGGASGNWGTEQTFTVTPGDNEEVGDGLDYTITVSVSSSGTDFMGKSSTLSGTVIDDGLSEEQTKIAIASADTFGTAQVATDLISGHLLAPPAAQPQAQLAGIVLGSTTNVPVQSGLEEDPWGNDEENAWQDDLAVLIPGTEFALPLSATDSSGGHYEIWGAAGYSDLDGDPTSEGEKTQYDGHATGVHIGIGRRYVNGTSFGVSIGSTKVELDIDSGSGDPIKVERDLISIHPYIGWTLQDGLAAWLIAGYGDGDYEQDDEKTKASLLMLGGGLQRSWSVNGNDLAVRLEGVTTESKLDTKGNLKGESSAWQGRVEFEIGRSFAAAGGGYVQPYGTFGYRHDGGDLGGSGAGEIGLGVRSQLSAAWTIDIKSRFQVTDSDHERRSIQGHVKYDRGADRRGWLFTLNNSLEYEVEDVDTDAEYTRVLEGQLGYGWSRTLLRQRGTLDLHLKASRGDEQEDPVIGLGFTSPLLRLGLDGSEDEVEVHFNYINTSL